MRGPRQLGTLFPVASVVWIKTLGRLEFHLSLQQCLVLLPDVALVVFQNLIGCALPELHAVVDGHEADHAAEG